MNITSFLQVTDNTEPSKPILEPHQPPIHITSSYPIIWMQDMRGVDTLTATMTLNRDNHILEYDVEGFVRNHLVKLMLKELEGEIDIQIIEEYPLSVVYQARLNVVKGGSSES